MTLKFKPYTDEQIDALSNGDLMEKGVYDFEVLSVEEKISRAMNEMLVVKLKAGGRVIKDYITMTDRMAFKFKHFCESIGLGQSYAAGELNLSDCIHGKGRVKIGVQEGSEKLDGTGKFPARNVVDDYVKCEMASVLKDAFEDKDISF